MPTFATYNKNITTMTRHYTHSLLLTLLCLCSTMLFTSCDLDEMHDHDQSMALSGQWTGDFGMFYTYDVRGHRTQFDSYDTDIVFYPEYDGAHYGWGKQVDYYDRGPYEYIYHQIEWQIRNGIVYVNYPHDPDMNCTIRDYRMTNDYFSGYIGDSSTRFNLRKIVDYYDWTPYVDTYSCGNRRDWNSGYYYVKAQNDSIGSSGIVGFGNRYNKK